MSGAEEGEGVGFHGLDVGVHFGGVVAGPGTVGASNEDHQGVWVWVWVGVHGFLFCIELARINANLI